MTSMNTSSAASVCSKYFECGEQLCTALGITADMCEGVMREVREEHSAAAHLRDALLRTGIKLTNSSSYTESFSLQLRNLLQDIYMALHEATP